ncbi:MAG: hypothetical protein D6704_04170 [Nitrospirae bacterium]|nr:MAG: hypothetical protein D6704_04170 [Nitrospirota bacterium]
MLSSHLVLASLFEANSPLSRETLQQRVAALQKSSRILDQWILERGSPETISAFRQGIELINQLNPQGLRLLENAMLREVNNTVFTPLFLRYIELIEAWEAADQEEAFLKRLKQRYPHSTQAQAAVVVRSAARARQELMKQGLAKINEALQKAPQNVLARTLRAALLIQQPETLSQGIMAFEEIQRAAEANSLEAQIVTFYREHNQHQLMSPQRFFPVATITPVSYLSERLDLQIKKLSPKAWSAIQQGRRMGSTGGGEPALSELEQALEEQQQNPVAFGVLLARYLDLAQTANRLPRAIALCAQLAELHPQSPQAKAAYGYVLATGQADAIMREGLQRLEQITTRDPNNFFLWTARVLYLAQTPQRMGEALSALDHIKSTTQFRLAAVDHLFTQAARTSPAVFAQPADSSPLKGQ